METLIVGIRLVVSQIPFLVQDPFCDKPYFQFESFSTTSFTELSHMRTPWDLGAKARSLLPRQCKVYWYVGNYMLTSDSGVETVMPPAASVPVRVHFSVDTQTRVLTLHNEPNDGTCAIPVQASASDPPPGSRQSPPIAAMRWRGSPKGGVRTTRTSWTSGTELPTRFLSRTSDRHARTTIALQSFGCSGVPTDCSYRIPWWHSACNHC